jgi:levanase/fructan beta-fructosidase
MTSLPPKTEFESLARELPEGQHLIEGAQGRVQRIEATFTPGTAEEFGLILRGNRTKGTRIGIRPGDGQLVLDRRESGLTDFHDSFASAESAPILPVDGTYQLTVYVDSCSVEVFAQNGRLTLTDLIFPDESSTELSLYANGGPATLDSLSVATYG